MVRPVKTGLDYFPLDTNIDQDDKVIIIIATHGMQGFGVLIKLLMEIYKNSYFYQWTEKEQIIFSSRVSVDINTINGIVSDCVKWGLFDRELYDTHHVLTSRGIQERFLLAVSRRVNINIKDELRLVSVDINPPSTELEGAESTQKKVKEKIVKEKTLKTSRHKFETCDLELAELLFQKMRENNPTVKKPNLESWANEVRLMRQVDKHTIEQIRYLIDWTQKDSFWRSNVLSIAKLRKQYDTLVLRVKEEKAKKVTNNGKTTDAERLAKEYDLGF